MSRIGKYPTREAPDQSSLEPIPPSHQPFGLQLVKMSRMGLPGDREEQPVGDHPTGRREGLFIHCPVLTLFTVILSEATPMPTASTGKPSVTARATRSAKRITPWDSAKEAATLRTSSLVTVPRGRCRSPVGSQLRGPGPDVGWKGAARTRCRWGKVSSSTGEDRARRETPLSSRAGVTSLAAAVSPWVGSWSVSNYQQHLSHCHCIPFFPRNWLTFFGVGWELLPCPSTLTRG